MTIAGHTFNNWTTANLGPMSLHTALVWSCDTVFYQIAYQMYLHDKYRANFARQPARAHPEDAEDGAGFGFGRDPGIDLPEQSPGTIPTRQWLYYYWKQYKHYWCKHGNANGSYLQQVDYDNCRTGYQWTPGQAAIAAIGQGYVSVTPLQLARAYAAIANGGTLYSPRVGEALLSPAGQGRPADQAPGGRAPSPAALVAQLPHQRAAGGRHRRHRGRAPSPGSR